MASTDSRKRNMDGALSDERESPRGWFEDREHVFPIRVYYEDTDAAGIVYYANYLRFAERARTEMIRRLGVAHRQLMADAGVAFAVRSCAAEYRAAARLDDEILVRTRLDAVGGATIRATQRIVRADAPGAQTELVELKLRLACLDRALRPARLPAPIRTAIAEFVDG